MISANKHGFSQGRGGYIKILEKVISFFKWAPVKICFFPIKIDFFLTFFQILLNLSGRVVFLQARLFPAFLSYSYMLTFSIFSVAS